MTDLDRLQGAWMVGSLEMDGAAMPAGPDARILIEGERFQSLGMGAVYEGTVEVDARKRPKAIDMVFTAGPEKGNRSLGIYELEGDGWRLCLTVTGSTRPKTFATAPGSGLALETLKRAGAAAMEAVEEPVAAESTASDPAPEIEGEWQMEACVADGYPVPEEMVKTGRRVAGNGETSSWFGGRRLMQARYTVDRSAAPHTIDYRLENGAAQYGIWKLEGGVLHIGFGAPGQARPADFRAGKGVTLTSWKRVS
jgi:uncharacterized protein (TIGR03067 family)